MRESIGNTFIFNWAIFLVAVIIALLIGSMSYSKSFKIKNKIIDIIEKHQIFTDNSNSAVREEIDQFLGEIGYRTSRNSAYTCKDGSGPYNTEDYNLVSTSNNNYRYCVYQKTTQRGYYYKVIVYMYFDVPMLGSYIEFPIAGETKLIYTL